MIPEVTAAGKSLALAVEVLRKELANVKHTREQERELVRWLALLEMSRDATRLVWVASRGFLTLPDKAAWEAAKGMKTNGT